MGKYNVKLNQEQREQLEQVIRHGKAPARKIARAHILLKTDRGPHGQHQSDQQIREALGVGTTLIYKVRKQFREEGMERALNRKKQSDRPQLRKINGEQEAQIIALMCMEQPEGQERWTLRALQQRIVELEIVGQVSHETIRTVLKKTN